MLSPSLAAVVVLPSVWRQQTSVEAPWFGHGFAVPPPMLSVSSVCAVSGFADNGPTSLPLGGWRDGRE